MKSSSHNHMNRQLYVFAIFLVLAAAASRLLRHFGFINLPPNVAPIAALALFGAAYLPRRIAVLLPFAAMLVSDVMIGFYSPAIMATVYLSFAACVVIGFWLRRSMSALRIAAASLTGSVLFFLTTNAAVWLFGTMYPKTLGGLGAAYLAGLPFFRNTVIGDLAFCGLMFGAYGLARHALRVRVPAF